MKYLKYFLILLFIPFIVLAEECDNSKITLTSIEQKGITGNTEEIAAATVKNRNINLNIKMHDVGDSITYDFTINNDSEEDYMIDEDTFKTDSEYIEYTLKTKDNTNVVKANSTKEVSLIVTYKKAVEDDKLTNNKFNASNTLKLSLNTSEKEQPLDIITTDNIKESLAPQEVKNPVTSVNSLKLIIIFLFTLIAIIYLTIHNKKKYNKYIILILGIILIPIVHAICKADISVDAVIEIEHIPTLNETIIDLTKVDDSCITKYEGEVTDEVGKTVPATKVYFDNCSEKRNVIFGGFCWQVIRTTETGGTKLIYNGEPVDGKCESTREKHKGIVQPSKGTKQAVNENYLYGSSFTYDTANSTFTLIDTETATWSDSTYENLLSKFTCKTTSTTCSTIYEINSYYSNTHAYLTSYTIADTNYAQIGKSSFNAESIELSMAGYMFNKIHNYKFKNPGTETIMYASSFDYNASTNTYTLSGTTKTMDDWSSGYNSLNNTHYTCWDTTGTCNNLSYIYYTHSGGALYHVLTEGIDIDKILEDMLSADDVNRYNSSIKGIIDNWYKANLLDYTNKIEDTVYCNNRSIMELNGWNPNGGQTKDGLMLKNYNFILDDLVCENETDQFTTYNNKAKLTYPVALLQNEEMKNISPLALLKTGTSWWEISPYYFGGNSLRVKGLDTPGEPYNKVDYAYGVRPVISLKSNNVISSGTGSETDPWIIE